jgi:hypothetical protein
LLLRSSRERAGLSLEQVRDRIEVPLVDLDALERGALEHLHLEQAAVVAIFRYAELLGLDADTLVDVARTFWPNRALAIDAFRVTAGSASAMSHLNQAKALLVPIASPRALRAGNVTIGLSHETIELLAGAVGKSSLGLEQGGPSRWSTPAISSGGPRTEYGAVAGDTDAFDVESWEYDMPGIEDLTRPAPLEEPVFEVVDDEPEEDVLAVEEVTEDESASPADEEEPDSPFGNEYRFSE